MWALSAGLVGFLVALGADGPEVTSALIAVTSGSSDVGLGVILGSNIYNLAGLLGLAAVIAGSVHTGAYRLTLDAGVNVLLTLLVLGLAVAGGSRPLVVLLSLIAVVVMLLDIGLLSLAEETVLHLFHRGVHAKPCAIEPEDAVEGRGRSPRTLVLLSVCSVVTIVAGSFVLVRASLYLGPALGVPAGIVGTFVLAIATSLPNSWATVSLARRGHAAAAISATFNSNSINLAAGACLPSLALSLHISHATRSLDLPWLLLMTVVTVALVATRFTVTRREGAVLIALYVAFVVLRLTLVA
jgi:cation:H+ antiporter